MFSLVLKQTIKLAFRRGGGAFGTLGFYIIIFTLFAFALSPEALHNYALAVMVVAMVLSSVAAQPLIFEADEEEGMLEQYLLKSDSLEFLVLAKILGHFVVQLLPILFSVPLLSLMSGLDFTHAQDAAIRLALFSPSISALNVLIASFTLGSRRGGLLPALLMLPLLMPLVIFASSLSGEGAIMLLAAGIFLSLPLSCYLSATIIRMV